MFDLNDSAYLLPGPYPGEHLFSILNRFWVRNTPALSQRQTIGIFKIPEGIFEPLNPVAFNRFTNAKELIPYTTYPYFLRLQTENLKDRFEELLSDNYKSSYLYLMPQSRYRTDSDKNSRSIFYCSECLSEDLKQYGEGYLRAVHQIDGLRVCLKHGKKLSSIRLERNAPFFIFDGSFEEAESGDPIPEETKLAKFLANPTDVDRDGIDRIVSTEAQKLTSLEYENEAGERILEETRQNLPEEFLTAYHVDTDTIVRVLRAVKKGNYLHPADLGIFLMGLGIEEPVAEANSDDFSERENTY